MSEFDKSCVNIEDIHGKVVRMKCLFPWSDEIYEATKDPFELSGMYSVECEDGAELILFSRFYNAACSGSIGFISDTTNKIDGHVRDERILAYLVLRAMALKREEELPHECILPTQKEAEDILESIGVPGEALKWESEMAQHNRQKIFAWWGSHDLITWDEKENQISMTAKAGTEDIDKEVYALRRVEK